MTGIAKNKTVGARIPAKMTNENPREAWALLIKLVRKAKASVMSACNEYELTSAQAQVLETLDPSAPVSMCNLAGSLVCDASNVTGLVDKLEARNLVERQADPNDRRVKMVALTATGKRLRADLIASLTEPPASIVDLPHADQVALVRILRQATASDERS